MTAADAVPAPEKPVRRPPGRTAACRAQAETLALQDILRGSAHALTVFKPEAVAKLEAWFLEMWPKPLLTRDQVTLLERDNVVSEGALTLEDLGVDPTPAETILPTYLRRFRPPHMQGRGAAETSG